MPTTTEVEARLRRAAQACESLVEDLIDDHPLAPTASRTVRPARPGRAGWLVAAALVVAVALAGCWP